MCAILPSSPVSLWRTNRPGRGDGQLLEQVSLLSEFNYSQAMFGQPVLLIQFLQSRQTQEKGRPGVNFIHEYETHSPFHLRG